MTKKFLILQGDQGDLTSFDKALYFGEVASTPEGAENAQIILEDFRTEVIREISEKFERTISVFTSKLQGRNGCHDTLLHQIAAASTCVEKANFYKSPYLDRLIIIETVRKWLSRAGYEPGHHIKVSVSDHALRKVLSCAVELSYEHSFVPFAALSKPLRLAISRLLEIISYLKGMAWLVWIAIQNVPSLTHQIAQKGLDSATLVVFDYFFNISAKDARLTSQFWREALQAEFAFSGPMKRIFLFAPSNSARTLGAARALRDNLEPEASFLEEFLAVGDFVSTARFLTRLMNGAIPAVPNASLQLHPREYSDLRREIRQSFLGTVAAKHALHYFATKRLVRELGSTSAGVLLYPAEFQGWETITISAFKEAGWKTAGYAHSSVKRWDLRGYHWKGFAHEVRVPSLYPDYLLSHSIHDRDLLLERTPSSELVLVEALRYQNTSKDMFPTASVRDSSRKKVLFVGGYSKSRSQELAKVADQVEKRSRESIEVYFLPHPALANQRISNHQIKRRPNQTLGALMAEFSLAVVDSETSAALDVVASGKNVIVYAQISDIPSSPGQGIAGVNVCYSASGVIDAINRVDFEQTVRLPEELQPIQAKAATYRLWRSFLRARGFGSSQTGETQ